MELSERRWEHLQQGPRSAMLWFLSGLRAITVFSPKQTRIWQAFVWKVEKRKPSGHVSPAILHCMSSGPWSPYRPRPHQSSHHTLCHLVHESPYRSSPAQAPSNQGQWPAINNWFSALSLSTSVMASGELLRHPFPKTSTLQHQQWPGKPRDTLHSPPERKESYSR